MKRLRFLDINTPWFWFTIFYKPLSYGDSWLEIELWEPHTHCKWWIYFYVWEDIPDSVNFELEPLSERE